MEERFSRGFSLPKNKNDTLIARVVIILMLLAISGWGLFIAEVVKKGF